MILIVRMIGVAFVNAQLDRKSGAKKEDRRSHHKQCGKQPAGLSRNDGSIPTIETLRYKQKPHG